MKIWMLAVLTIFVMGGFVFVIGYSLDSGTSTPGTSSTAEPSGTETLEPEPEAKPITFEPIIITGSSDKKSPPFTVTTEEWIIDWSFVPDPEYPEFAIFGFYVYPRGETLWDVESVLFPAGTSGSTYSYAGPGEYYVKVTAANIESWEIIISPGP